MSDTTYEHNVAILSNVRAGDRVTILVPGGIGRHGVEWKEKSGRAVMRGLLPHSWVLNMGGRYGTPGVATPENTVAVRFSRAV
jgi:hypothetical protein